MKPCVDWKTKSVGIQAWSRSALPEKAHMIMVVYDSDSTRASNLLHRFQERGLHAQVVGM